MNLHETRNELIARNAESELEVDILFEEFQRKFQEELVRRHGDADAAYEALCGHKLGHIESEPYRWKLVEANLDEASSYADYVTTRAPTKSGITMRNHSCEDLLQRGNNTAIANLAYVALHSTNSEDREHCKALVNQWQARMKQETTRFQRWLKQPGFLSPRWRHVLQAAIKFGQVALVLEIAILILLAWFFVELLS